MKTKFIYYVKQSIIQPSSPSLNHGKALFLTIEKDSIVVFDYFDNNYQMTIFKGKDIDVYNFKRKVEIDIMRGNVRSYYDNVYEVEEGFFNTVQTYLIHTL